MHMTETGAEEGGGGQTEKRTQSQGQQTLVRKAEEKQTVHTLKVLSGIFDNRINHHTNTVSNGHINSPYSTICHGLSAWHYWRWQPF